MNKAVGTVISPNAFRLNLGLAPIPPRKHKLKVWTGDFFEMDNMIRFKCVKCNKGGLVLEREAVRAIVAGEPGWSTYFTTIAWGSWQLCREDAPPTTPDWRSQ